MVLKDGVEKSVLLLLLDDGVIGIDGSVEMVDSSNDGCVDKFTD